MLAKELREKYLQFFEKYNHTRISGASLIPENDPTVLFTTAGMHPLVPYILGEPHPNGTRLVSCQRCIRTGDIEEVGDYSHLTFFEMLGNWSLGDYFKEEALTMSFEFLTSSEWLGIDKNILSVSVYEGDENVPADEESARLWERLGIPRDRIFFLGRTHNWWGPAGATGPCGPDSEMFIDTGIVGEPNSSPASSDGKYLEIWNDVFMQYKKTPQGTFEPLERKCVDTGMGLERTASVLQGKKSAFDTELFTPILQTLEGIVGKGYTASDKDEDKAFRIIADHIRTAVFILGDEKSVSPSNLGQGYILRRLIRRAMRFGRKLGQEKVFLEEPALAVLDIYGDVYPSLQKNKDFIMKELHAEEEKFLVTLQRGEKEFIKIKEQIQKTAPTQDGRVIPGAQAFHLYDTYGFPKEITIELAREHGMRIDEEGFEVAYAEHQNKSKSDSAQTFKGGLQDHSEATTKLHTATHLLHQALRDVLGSHVSQKGSNITKDRLRFDFSHPEKMSAEEIARVQSIVNEKIQEALPISMDVMTLEEAKDKGALAFFNDKYDEQVKMYSIGNYSKEVCGGPHITNTSELKNFAITKEQSSSQGVRRIKAIVG